ncbi:protein draper-like [Mytilus edulis]|uniref:protein draper-like n=1 Tax=Mytilus edulis TaxID=6550 RepID=UPI0039EF6C08
MCDIQTAVCTDGCEPKRTGHYCSKYNIASDGRVSQTPSGSQPSSLANDGNTKSCSKTKGTTVTFQVDLQKESIVTGVHIIFGESTTREGNHTLYASNTSTSWKSGTILYKETSLPSEIKLYAVFRYMTYESPVEGLLPELEVCEIGIVGCPPSHYGLLCNKWCPENCNGPCDLDTGKCIFSCLNGWHGDTCEQACEAGTYGKDCLATCSPHCLYPQCHGVTGECLVGCNDGWQGFNCSQRCPTGQFGRNCSMLCDGCVSRMCDPNNGLCDITTACNPGYINGQYCNTPCIDGFYGINCHQVCSQLCLHKPCDRRTGECNGGCVHGIQGFNCTEVSSIKENVDSPVITQVGLFAGGCLFGAVIATVVCCIIIKKRQKRTKQGKENTTMETQRNELQHYDDVKMDNVSTYQEITTEQYDQINTAYINH